MRCFWLIHSQSLCVVLEYLATEVLEIVGNAARDGAGGDDNSGGGNCYQCDDMISVRWHDINAVTW